MNRVRRALVGTAAVLAHAEFAAWNQRKLG
jgi:hypothetical protein